MEAARCLNSAECEKRGRDAHDGIQRRTSHALPPTPVAAWALLPSALLAFSQLLFGSFVAPLPCLNAEAQACPTVTPWFPTTLVQDLSYILPSRRPWKQKPHPSLPPRAAEASAVALRSADATLLPRTA